MKCIFGSVVGRKFQKVSHKIAKVRCTKKEEHIVLENMHEPIIDIETWNKAQDKLNGFNKVRDRKYDHELKGFVYCGEIHLVGGAENGDLRIAFEKII